MKQQPDTIAEMFHGEGAVRVAGKFVIRGAQNNDGQILIAGSCFRVDGQTQLAEKTPQYWERWDCVIYIVPRRKLCSGPKGKNGGHAYAGHRIDQILAENFGNDENWGKEFWRATDYAP